MSQSQRGQAMTPPPFKQIIVGQYWTETDPPFLRHTLYGLGEDGLVYEFQRVFDDGWVGLAWVPLLNSSPVHPPATESEVDPR